MEMPGTPQVNKALLEKAKALTGLQERAAILNAGLEAVIARESARRLIAPGQHHGGGRRGCGGGEKVAAQHGVSASGEMNLRLRTRTARAAAVETSRGASTSSA